MLEMDLSDERANSIASWEAMGGWWVDDVAELHGLCAVGYNGQIVTLVSWDLFFFPICLGQPGMTGQRKQLRDKKVELIKSAKALDGQSHRDRHRSCNSRRN